MGRSPGERGSQKTCLAGKIVPPCEPQARRPNLKGPSKLGATLQMTISSEGFFIIFNTLSRRTGSYEKNLYRTDHRRLS
jgi:hypothetical protein